MPASPAYGNGCTHPPSPRVAGNSLCGFGGLGPHPKFGHAPAGMACEPAEALRPEEGSHESCSWGPHPSCPVERRKMRHWTRPRVVFGPISGWVEPLGYSHLTSQTHFAGRACWGHPGCCRGQKCPRRGLIGENLLSWFWLG